MKDLILGFVVGLLVAGFLVYVEMNARHNQFIDMTIKSGRLSNYYLVPVPTLQEYNQLQLDLKTYAKVKHKGGKR